jgi:copper(I)-binding protein
MRLFPVAAALAAVLAAPVQAASFRHGALEARDPWSRPAAAGTNGAGYFTLVNHGRKAETLTGAESPVAARVEIHRMSMSGAVMSMARARAVSAPPGGQVAFGPGAYHLMLLKLKRPLRLGEEVPATLVFASGARLRLNLKVALSAPAGGKAPADHMHMGR